jgi:hypothetical protein
MPNITNPEAFQLEAATILAAVYSAFPIPFVWEHDPDNENYPTETGQSRKDIQFQTINWLIEHRYLIDDFGVVGEKWEGPKTGGIATGNLEWFPGRKPSSSETERLAYMRRRWTPYSTFSPISFASRKCGTGVV